MMNEILEKYDVIENEVVKYIEQWEHPERFCDLGYFLRNGYLHEAIVTIHGTGVIDPGVCFEHAKNMESCISEICNKVSKHEADVSSAIKNAITIQCKNCNMAQFLEPSNFSLYERDLRDKCWGCGETDLEFDGASKDHGETDFSVAKKRALQVYKTYLDEEDYDVDNGAWVRASRSVTDIIEQEHSDLTDSQHSLVENAVEMALNDSATYTYAVPGVNKKDKGDIGQIASYLKKAG